MPISARMNPGVVTLAALLLLAGTTALGASATVYVDDSFAGLTTGDDPPGPGTFYWDGIGIAPAPADSTHGIQFGVTLVNPSGTINVDSGTYNEDVNLNKAGVSVLGAGAATTTIVGQLGGANETFLLGASNTRLSGFTITRNTGVGENNIGVTTVTGGTGIRIDNNTITLNRSGIYFNGSSSSCTVENNTVTDNRTGLIFADSTAYTNYTIRNNFITLNRTFGILFNGATATVTGASIVDNDISGNFASQFENNSTSNIDVSRNWWGAGLPTLNVSNVNQNAVLPPLFAYPGPAVPPGPPYPFYISGSGPKTVNIWLSSGTDADANPANGFQPQTVATFGAPIQANLQTAINAIPATWTLEVPDDTYTGLFTVAKALTIEGESNTGTILQAPVYGGPNPPPAALMAVSSQNVTIDNLRFEMNQSHVRFGVHVASGSQFNNLNVLNSVFVSNGNNPMGFADRTTAINIQAGGAAANHAATIRTNQIIQGTGGPAPSGVSTFPRGIWFFQGVPTIGGPGFGDGNTIVASFQDCLLQFTTNGPALLENNLFNGAGIDVTEPNNAGQPFAIQFNTFVPGLNPNTGLPFAAQSALLKHDYFSRPITFANNFVFTYGIGVYAGAATAASINDNTFIPDPGATSFTHVLVDTDFPGTGITSGFSPVPANTTTLQGNFFGDSGVPGGIGLAFRRGVSAGNARPMGAMTVGGSGVENYFEDDLAYFVALDSDTANAAGSPSPLDAFNALFTTIYTSPAPGRTVLPFSNNITIADNTFEVPTPQVPSAMTAGELAAFELRLWHDPDDAPAGLLLYGGIPLFPEVYVDDSFAGGFGTPVTPTHPPAAPTAYIGINAFTTINAGIQQAQATGTVYVADGSYTELVAVDRAVTLDGESDTGTILQAPVYGGPNPPPPSLMAIQAADIEVNDMRFEMNQSHVRFGVHVASGQPFNNLAVVDNVFVSNGNNPLPFADRTTAINIQAGGAGLNHTASIRGNDIIQGTGGAGPSFVSTFPRGIWTFAGVPTVGGPNPADGNTITGAIQDALMQFSTNGPVLVQNNTFLGAGIDVTEPNNGGVPFQILDNFFTPGLNPNTGQPWALQAVLLKHDYFSRPITFSGNTVTTRSVGVYSGAATNALFSANTFNVAAGVSVFTHLLVDTDFPGTGITSGFAPVPANTTTIIDNNFNSGASPGGNAVAFRRGVSAGNVRPMGAMTMGGVGDENFFGPDFANFIVLDSDTANAAGSASPLDAFNAFFAATYTSPAPGRTVLPFSDNIDIAENFFSVPTSKKPNTMTLAEYSALELRLWHDPDDAPAGLLTFGGFPLTSPIYVDDDFAGPIGTPVSPTYPPAAPTAFFGINAFSNINPGIQQCLPSGTVYIAAGDYVENVNVTKPITLDGEDRDLVTVYPAASNPICGPGSLCAGAASTIFLISASDVQMYRIGMDGDNTSLVSGVVRNGADLNARNGIITNHLLGPAINNLLVNDCRVENIYLRGIQAGTNFGSFSFIGNEVTNVEGEAGSIAILNFGGTGLIQGNTVSQASDGIALNNSVGTTVELNTVTDVLSGIHSDNNGSLGGPSTADVIDDNTVDCQQTFSYGVWVFDPYLDVVVSDNEVDGSNVGLGMFGGQAGARPVFSGNDVDGGSAADTYGAYFSTSLFGFGSANASVDFGPDNLVADNDYNVLVEQELGFTSDLDIHDNTGINGAAVRGFWALGTGVANDVLIDNTPFSGNATHVRVEGAFVSSTGNTYTGGATGFDVQANGGTFLCENIFTTLSSWNIDLAAGATPAAQYIHGNQFDGTGNGVRNQAAAQLNAEGNWWGVSTGPNTGGNTTSGNIDFTPWQTSIDAPAFECWTGFIAPCDNDGFLAFPPLVLADDCDLSTVVIEYSIGGSPIGGDGASYNYPYGQTTVDLTVSDDDGSSSCSFLVERFFNVQPPLRSISIGPEDGYITQMAEMPTTGFLFNSKETTFNVGDTTTNLANRGILSFDTTLPADAVILSARIRLTQTIANGSVASLGGLVLDAGNPNIGGSAAFAATDWDDASAAHLNIASTFPLPAANAASTFAEIDPAHLDKINPNGKTQFRVRFNNLTNSNNTLDQIVFASGTGTSATQRPEMIIEYYIDNVCYVSQPQTTAGSPVTVELWSTPADDGQVVEAHETYGVGGSMNATAGSFQVGDTASRQQMMGVLSFDLTGIPANATIQSATLRLYRTSGIGTPASLGALTASLRIPQTPFFGPTQGLEFADFESFAHIPNVATFAPLPLNNQYIEVPLTAGGRAFLNKGGVTQFKINFALDDNNNLLSDQITFASGNFGVGQPARPRLLITYLAP